MKKSGITITTLIAAISATLGIPESEATTLIEKQVNSYSTKQFTINQQKQLFNFSTTHASLGMSMIKGWDSFSELQRHEIIAFYCEKLVSSIQNFVDKNEFIQRLGDTAKGVLAGNALDNARNLLVQKDMSKKAQYENSFEKVKTNLTQEFYKQTGEVVLIACVGCNWGQHGAHFGYREDLPWLPKDLLSLY